jgi:predicted metallo-beta-lactamase superfamily hydrolase
MTIEFKPTRPETQVLHEIDEHGRERLCIATRIERSRNWRYQLIHPEGEVAGGTIKHSNEAEVAHYLSQVMEAKRNEFINARNRGDKPVYRPNTVGSPADSVTTLMPSVMKG